ncbi:RNA-binding protein [Thermoplasmatales archaeon SG8-52-1]|nr:MAG: RNA-binding protein [Thermoplasmatales archaeon SG8-52-1]
MTITPSIKKEYLVNLAENGKRSDGRKFDEFRKISIETGVISKAEGSARVKIGNTQVISGIKMDIGEPYPDSPESGVMTTAAELIPLASPDFEAGPPREDAIELARVVDRGIRESELIEVDKLCIEPGEKVWMVFIDIHILDFDGNLFDAASLASLAALLTTNVPAERFDLGENYPLPLKEPPISCTSVKYNGVVVMDPSLDEEEIAEARLTVATDINGHLRAMQKGLNGSFSVDEIKKVIKASIDNGRKIQEQLYKSVGK